MKNYIQIVQTKYFERHPPAVHTIRSLNTTRPHFSFSKHKRLFRLRRVGHRAQIISVQKLYLMLVKRELNWWEQEIGGQFGITKFLVSNLLSAFCTQLTISHVNYHSTCHQVINHIRRRNYESVWCNPLGKCKLIIKILDLVVRMPNSATR